VADAEAAALDYPGLRSHVFPRCFVCAPARAQADGLRIFPGPLGAGGLLAAPWTPDASLADDTGAVCTKFLWAALDCPGGFAVLAETGAPAIVLRELCASLSGELRSGDECVVLGWPLGAQGRRHLACTAVYGPQGRLVASARAVWIEVPPGAWG
jgi:hypothetical protein